MTFGSRLGMLKLYGAVTVRSLVYSVCSRRNGSKWSTGLRSQRVVKSVWEEMVQDTGDRCEDVWLLLASAATFGIVKNIVK